MKVWLGVVLAGGVALAVGACGGITGPNTEHNEFGCMGQGCADAAAPPVHLPPPPDARPSPDGDAACTANISHDVDNCGSCGHSCGGGQCVGGYCQPVLLAGNPSAPTGLKSLYGLTMQGGALYGTNWEGPAGLVYKASTTPGTPLTWIVGMGMAASAEFITANGDAITYSLYHVGEPVNAGIWKVKPDGTGNTLVVPGGTTGGGPACNLATAYGYEVGGVAFDSGYIYWIRDTYGGCFPSTKTCQCQGVYRSNADGTGVTQFFTSNWYTLPVADSGSLYMVDYFNSQVVVATSSSFTRNTAPVPLPQAGTPSWLQTDASYVYWVDASTSRFYRAKKVAAVTAEDITPASGMPTGGLWSNFLIDQANIYFVSPPPTPNTAAAQKIYAMPKDGSGPAHAIPGANISALGDSVSAWTQDATALYWTTYGFDNGMAPFSAVYKIAK